MDADEEMARQAEMMKNMRNKKKKKGPLIAGKGAGNVTEII